MTDLPESIEASPRSRRTWMALGGIVIAAALLAFVFAGRFGQDPRLVESPLVGSPLPELTLPYLEQDGSLDLSDLRGEVLVVNFWASWCFPCRIEHPALTAASTTYGEDGVHFIGILYQDNERPAVAFLDELGRGENYTYLVDEDSRATVELGVFGVPETFFVDREGIVRGRVQGEVTPAVLFQALEDVLAGRTPDL